MRKIIRSAAAVILIGAAFAFSYSCDSLFFFKEGSSITMTSYDDKDKLSGTQKTVYTKITKGGTTTSVTASSEYFDKKGKSTSKGDYTIKCDKGVLYFDMKMMVPQEQTEAFKDMEVTMEGADLEMPSNLTVGTTLKDANITMNFKPKGSDGSMSMPGMTFSMSITNRKVEAKENITTSAGTFECYKITEDISMKSIFPVKAKSVSWFSLEAGTVKTESYKDNGKYMGKSELTELKK